MQFLLRTNQNSLKFMKINEVDVSYTYKASEGADISAGRVEIYSPTHDFFYGFVIISEQDWENGAIASEKSINLRRGIYFANVEEYLEHFASVQTE